MLMKRNRNDILMASGNSNSSYDDGLLVPNIDGGTLFSHVDPSSIPFNTISDILQEFPALLETVKGLGLVPTDLATIRESILANATTYSPKAAFNSPGSPDENILSVASVAVAMIQRSIIDSVFSINPLASNPLFLDSFAKIYGVARGDVSNGSATIIVTAPVGLIIPQYSIFQDVNGNTYRNYDAGTCGSDGTCQLVVYASNFIDSPILAHTINIVVTNFLGKSVTCDNPENGNQGVQAQTDAEFRRDILDAGLVLCKSTPAFVKTMVGKIAGVVKRTINLGEVNGKYVITASGGDPIQVAGAIFLSMFDFFFLSAIRNDITYISADGTNALIAFKYIPGLAVGDTFQISNAPAPFDGENDTWTGTVAGYYDPHTIIVNITLPQGFNYSGGAYLTNDSRNMQETVYDGIDPYVIRWVSPIAIVIDVQVDYVVLGNDIIDNATIQANGEATLTSYLNSLSPNSPINLTYLENLFSSNAYAVIPPESLGDIKVSVSTNGVPIQEQNGAILLDSFSYPVAGTLTFKQVKTITN